MTDEMLRKARRHAKSMCDTYSAFCSYYTYADYYSVSRVLPNEVKNAYLDARRVYLMLTKYNCSCSDFKNNLSNEFESDVDSIRFCELITRYSFLQDNLEFLKCTR